MFSSLNDIENVSIEVVDGKEGFHTSHTHPERVNVYINERMKRVQSAISAVGEYDNIENTWQTNHIVSDPTIGKKILKPFRYGNGKKDEIYAEEKSMERFKEAVGDHSILTTKTEEEHAIIRGDYLKFFSSVYKNDDFNINIQKNIEMYLERCVHNGFPISLSTLVGELISVVMQNTVNGYPHDISQPSFWIGKLLAPTEIQLKPIEEIDYTVQIPNNSWFSYSLSAVVRFVKPVFKKFAIDRHANSIYNQGIKQNGSFPKYLKDKGYSEEEIKGNIKTSFFTQETMRNLLLFLLYDYAKNKKTQKEDRISVLNFDKELLTTSLPEEIERNVLMGLHKYPTGGSTRTLNTDVCIRWTENGIDKEHYIQKGEAITYSPYTASRWPLNWEEYFREDSSEEFSRQDLQELKKLPHLPFGSGTHECPAKKFVVPVMGIILCVFLRKCTIELCDPTQECKPVMSSTLQPDKDIHVVVAPHN